MARTDIEQLIEDWTPALKSAFLEVMDHISSRVDVGEIARLLEEGRIEEAVRAINLDPALFRPLDAAMAAAYENTGNLIAGDIAAALRTKAAADFLFNVRNPEAESWLRSTSSRLVVEITEDTRQAIRQHLQLGMAKGDNPRTTARALIGTVNPNRPGTARRQGGVLGLTSKQQAWAANYEQELLEANPKALERKLRDKRFDRSVKKAIKTGEPIPAATVQKMVTAYRERALRSRAEMLARTETMGAIHASQDETYRQAMESGTLSGDRIIKTWRSASDGRVRDTHRDMNGQQQPYHGVFRSPSGARLRYPGDQTAPAAEIIGCRCWLDVRVQR